MYSCNDTVGNSGCCVTPAPVNIPGPAGPAAPVPITGTGTLVAGTVTISAAVDSVSTILVQRTTGTGTLGWLAVTTVNVAGGTFTVTSLTSTATTQTADTSSFFYFIFG